MSREKAKPKQNCKTQSSDHGSILPEDKEIAKRYIEWKNLLDKYNKTDEVEDDGMSIEEVIQLYEKDDEEQYTQADEALECSEEDDDKDSSKGDYAALKNEMTTALQERNAEWKTNGMDEIFNSNFNLSVDYVQRWLGECEQGTGRQVTRARETRYTEYDGKTQMDVTHRENISILNNTERKQLTTEHSSNYEFCDPNQRRVIVHQIEKSTISSYITSDSNGTGNGTLTLPFDSFFGNVSSFTPFKLPNHIPSLKALTCSKDQYGKQLQKGRTINTNALDGSSLIKLMENSLKIVPKSQVENDIKNKAPRRGPTRKVRFKATKKIRQLMSDSSESSDSDQTSEDSNSSSKSSPKRRPTHVTNKRSTRLFSSSDTSPAVSPASITRANETNTSSTHGASKSGNGYELKSSIDSHQPPRKDTQHEQQQYPMPTNYRQMLSVNGHCPYKTDGTIIYRPKPIHQGLSRADAGRIIIQKKDLDLSGIKSALRRKKFDNFSRQMHPNSVLVYYMSDSEDEPINTTVNRDSDDDSTDDDDPILRNKPQLFVLSFFNAGA
uniref:Uncharacterized protein n=1 Tax=Anopheles culicifacies TaxID=139723 RepID=A0A182LRR5_9DIPT